PKRYIPQIKPITNMNKLYYLILFSIMITSCNNPSKKLKDNTAEVRAKLVSLAIRSVKVYQYRYVFGRPNTSTGFVINEQELDSRGNIISDLSKTKDDSTHENQLSLYAYDEKGHMIEETDKDMNGKIVRVIRNKYQGDNNIERAFFNADGSPDDKVSYGYEGNNCTLVTSYDNKGVIKFRQ